jgi:ribosomal protein S7
MFEELISERRDVKLSSSKQEELIEKYCTGIEGRIRVAGEKNNAKKIVNDACKGLEKECKSDVIRSFLQQYVRDLYENHWNKK